MLRDSSWHGPAISASGASLAKVTLADAHCDVWLAHFKTSNAKKAPCPADGGTTRRRFTMLLHLPPMPGHGSGPRTKNGPALAGHGAEAVRDAIARTIATLPEQLRRSLTWDQGAEMAKHAELRIETGLSVYFCDSHSPWQRGSNENTNGLLRQYFPKGTDLAAHAADDLAAVAHARNARPRKTLGWRTPAEALDKIL